jgi:hypothetical protein
VHFSLLSGGGVDETWQTVLALSSCADKVNHFGRCLFLCHIGSGTKNGAHV